MLAKWQHRMVPLDKICYLGRLLSAPSNKLVFNQKKWLTTKIVIRWLLCTWSKCPSIPAFTLFPLITFGSHNTLVGLVTVCSHWHFYTVIQKNGINDLFSSAHFCYVDILYIHKCLLTITKDMEQAHLVNYKKPVWALWCVEVAKRVQTCIWFLALLCSFEACSFDKRKTTTLIVLALHPDLLLVETSFFMIQSIASEKE